MDTQLPVERALRALGDLLAAEAADVRLVIVGGAALNLLGIIQRSTHDVDGLAIARAGDPTPVLGPPEPLPPALVRACASVARAALIALKLYAAADQTGPDNRHVQDLLALRPTADELAAAGAWITETQDPALTTILERVTAYVRAQLR